MLRNTFCHIAGVGPKTERRLWHSGILSWEDVREASQLPLPQGASRRVVEGIERSAAELAAENVRYFADALPSEQSWRLFPEFRHCVAYLDIETTGLGGPGDYITAIGLYDGTSIRHYVFDENLEQFAEDIEPYRLLVTYNGKCFDLPFIRAHLGLRMDQAHVDLRYLLNSLGYRGGLKQCEKQLGIERGDLAGVDGFMAVLLWHDYAYEGNPKALETLLAYNAADVVHLEQLMVFAYNLKASQTGFPQMRQLPTPRPPALPYRADVETLARLQWRLQRALEGHGGGPEETEKPWTLP